MTTLLLLLSLTAGPKLTGTWLLEGRPFLSLDADGTGRLDAEPVRWRVDKNVLTLTDAEGESDRVPFVLRGDTLTLTFEGVALQLSRNGAAQAPARTEAGRDQLSQLLLSSSWCWLKYASGNTYTQKVRFAADGSWQDSSESDIGGSNVWTQSSAQATGSRASGGRWQVRNGQLWLSSPDSPQLQPVELTITRNANGYPLITADGREYSMCN